MQAEDQGKARREFAEVTQRKVLHALRAAKAMRPADTDADAVAEDAAGEPETVEELTAQARLMSRLGFKDVSLQYEEKLGTLKSRQSKAKSELDSRILHQRMWALDQGFRRRREAHAVAQAEERARFEAATKEEERALSEAQVKPPCDRLQPPATACNCLQPTRR